MDQRLFAAALNGDSNALFQLLREDPLILHTVTLATLDTPLHIATLLGHTEFAKIVMQQNPELARELNQQGYSPIHIASSKGYVEIVRELLNMDMELCTLRDKDGRTALHCAGIKGRRHVLDELLSRRPELAGEQTPSDESVLHLVVKNNQCEAFASLLLVLQRLGLVDELINSKDEEGNTVLHLATMRKQYQTLKTLLRDDMKADVNAVNSNGQTALDLSVSSPFESEDMVISEMLRRAGGERASSSTSLRLIIPPPQSADPPQEQSEERTRTNRNHPRSTSNSRSNGTNNSENLVQSVKNGIIALAALFATVTFEVALNPPGGLWQDWNAINDTQVIEAATKANVTNNIGVLKVAKFLSKTFPLLPFNSRQIPNLNVTEPSLRGPAKAMNVALAGEDFIKFLYFDTICFMGSLATVFLVMFTSNFRGYQTLAVTIMMVVVLFSAGAVFSSGVSLVMNNQFGEWVIKVGITHLIMAGLLFIFIVSWIEYEISKKIKKMHGVMREMVVYYLCQLYHWLKPKVVEIFRSIP